MLQYLSTSLYESLQRYASKTFEEGYIPRQHINMCSITALVQYCYLPRRYWYFLIADWGNTNSQLLCTTLAFIPQQKNLSRKRKITNNNINQNTQTPLHIITLLISQKATHNNNRHNQHHNIKHLEIQIHGFIKAPTDDYDEGRVEKGGLDGGAEDVCEGEVHLIVPGFVDGREVLGGFFDEGNENETHEGVGDAAFDYYVFNFFDWWREWVSIRGDRLWNAAMVTG